MAAPLARPQKISAFEAYTLDELSEIFGKTPRLIRDTFICPRDLKTHKRLLDEHGSPVPGVRHFTVGKQCVVHGRTLMEWMDAHGDVCVD